VVRLVKQGGNAGLFPSLIRDGFFVALTTMPTMTTMTTMTRCG